MSFEIRPQSKPGKLLPPGGVVARRRCRGGALRQVRAQHQLHGDAAPEGLHQLLGEHRLLAQEVRQSSVEKSTNIHLTPLLNEHSNIRMTRLRAFIRPK